MIAELRYTNTNTYLIRGKRTSLLFDTGWAGTLPAFFRALGEAKLTVQEIGLIVISHFHPDHMGIAQEIADAGAQVVILDVQRDFVHASDGILLREDKGFKPIDDSRLTVISESESGRFLASHGFSGELIHTPGHSDDSISLWLKKERALFVGDLNPLYELEMHKGTQIGESWEKLLALKPKTVYYGHAGAAKVDKGVWALIKRPNSTATDIHAQVKAITRLIDKGCPVDEIQRRTGADAVFVQDVTRMYLTHPGVSVQGILDRIEIKGR